MLAPLRIKRDKLYSILKRDGVSLILLNKCCRGDDRSLSEFKSEFEEEEGWWRDIQDFKARDFDDPYKVFL